MAPKQDSFLDLERHRQMLEDNAEQTRRLLQQWRLWDAEYEALKEEVASSSKPSELARVRRDFEGELVTSKEVAELFGGPNGTKTAEQILGQLGRRLDYVQRNVEALEKKLRDAEDKAAAAAVVSAPDVRDDDGLPITDIVEELDDDDNVISYRLQVPSDSRPQLKEALAKAGVSLSEPTTPAAKGALGATAGPAGPTASIASAAPVADPAADPVSPPGAVSPRPAPARKKVSFGEDTKPGADSPTPGQSMSAAQKRIEAVMRSAREQEALSSQPAVIPEHESAEDAALRRDMLAYSMSEIGPVVAELELEEGYSDVDDGDEADEYDYFYEEDDADEDGGQGEEGDDDDDDGESGHHGGYLSDRYRQRIAELERKLGLSGPASAQADEKQKKTPGEAEEADEPRIGRIAIAGAEPAAPPRKLPGSPTYGHQQKQQAKGKVRFAESLDIAEETSPPVARNRVSRPQGWGDVVERNTPRQSAFHSSINGNGAPKAAMGGPREAPQRFLEAQETRTAPPGPQGQTIATSLVERQPAVAVRQPDEFDATLLHQEAAVEYQRVRNKLIHKGGGFLREDTSPVVPLDETEGGPKRMSRFKAARLSRQ